MALLLKKMYLGYYWLFEDIADPRSAELGLFLMSSPMYPVMVIAAYLYFIYNIGPKFMANRKPFDLKYILIIFNIAQVLVNAYIFFEAMYEILVHADWDCYEIDYSYAPRAIYMLKLYHLFFLTKLADLLDTIFFVLKKNYRQISFLHVYHHFGMFVMMWIVIKFMAGGHGTWTGLINAFVHVIMYSYYLLTTIDVSWKKSITFKKFITQVQMVQFLVFIIIYGRLLVKPDCGYPKIGPYFFVPQNFFMLLLFADFYRKTYFRKPSSTPSENKIKNN